MTEANYKLGAATQLDVVDAQQSLRQAENIRNLALYTHANARATLRFVMGRDPLERTDAKNEERRANRARHMHTTHALILFILAIWLLAGAAACAGTEAETPSAPSKRRAAFRCARRPCRRAIWRRRWR